MARYIFIFLWTPALTSIQRAIQLRDVDGSSGNAQELLTPDSHGDVDELPFGWIFSSFMVCCMLGTMAFSHLTNLGVSASKSLVWILALSAVSCLAMAAPSTVDINSNSGALSWQYAGMLLYEFCIGAYYPAMGTGESHTLDIDSNGCQSMILRLYMSTVKGTIVPEDQRAAIYNVFRLPLNLMVLLYLVGDFNTQTSFLANALMLMIACGLQLKLVRSAAHEHSK
jgi:MFS family permease